ncbi:hypothetical protein OG963_03600 [Streptomyces sp. NBC_01707]|uniref:hypothetical protein n=1 Tax=Streptomyces sp. NBC_01707 TaxID=2975914 RepID=UPI00352FB80F
MVGRRCGEEMERGAKGRHTPEAPNGFGAMDRRPGIAGGTDPQRPWIDGRRHLVEWVEKVIRTVTWPEHAFHALEVMPAVKRSSEEGRVVEVDNTFPDFEYGAPAAAVGDGRAEYERARHESRRVRSIFTRAASLTGHSCPDPEDVPAGHAWPAGTSGSTQVEPIEVHHLVPR